MTRARAGTLVVWFRVAAVVGAFATVAIVWQWFTRTAITLEDVAAWIEPHRHAWYAGVVVVAAFTLLGFAMVPVMLMIAATGLAFGPILGPVYALAGSLASASAGFLAGRCVGQRRIEELGGDRIRRATRALRRNGTLAVYFVRKIPAPFTLVNIVIGASTVRYRDFVIGTTLGMAPVVIALAGFGYQLAGLVRDPSPESVLTAAAVLAVPLTLAILINSRLRRPRLAE